MTAPPRTPSILGNWIHAIIRALDARGFDGTQIALDAGIAPRVVRDPAVRALQPVVTELFRRAVELTGDPSFGLKIPHFVTPATFGAYAYGVMASPNLEAMFGRVTRYQRFISESSTTRFTVGADLGIYEIIVVSPDGPPPEGIDAFLLLTVGTARRLASDRQLAPVIVRMRRPAPANPEPFHRAFRCELQFDADANTIEYTKADLQRRLPDGNIALAQQNDEIVAQQLASMDDETLAARVHRALVETMPDGPTERTIARQLALSPSHMHRLLTTEGVSYRVLLNRAREDLARGYLRQGRHSIKEIAFLLGFSDAAAFTRAFKRWTGSTPRHYADSGR